MQIKGLVRNKGLNEFADGDCQEIINMRYRDNAWRPVIDPPAIKSGEFANTYKAIWLHVQDNVRNYIAWDTAGRLVMLNSSTWAETLIKDYGNTEIDVKFLKRMMIVLGGSSTDLYLWSETAYVKIEKNVLPTVNLEEVDASIKITDEATTAEGVVGMFRKLINEESINGYLIGAVAFRFAWKLYDGSFINHTIPDIFLHSGDYEIHRRSVTGADPYHMRQIPIRKFKAKYTDLGGYNAYDVLNKDIFTSLCVFMSQPQEYYQIDTETITDGDLTTFLRSGISQTKLSTMGVSQNDEWAKLADTAGWYLVHEIDLEDIQGVVTYEEEIDLKRFHSDWASRQVLTIDSFSHHDLGGNVGFIYNDRVILGATTTVFGTVDIGNTTHLFAPDPTYVLNQSLVQGKICVVIKTDSGERRVYSDRFYDIYTKGGQYHIIVTNAFLAPNPNKIIGYQDARAVRIEIILPDTVPGTWKLFGSIKLTKSKNDNYAYYHAGNYELIVISSATTGTATTLNENQTSLFDDNRVQVSELRNPLVYPARLSYQVGTGTILAMGANTEPLSTGQYGQYPLSVFTSKGIWALEQGQGDVIFAAISPLSGDVILNKDQVVSVGNGVVFTTNRGVFAISGKQLAQLSEALEGPAFADFTANDHFQNFIDSSNLVALLPYISADDALTYISGAKAGFDKINNELYFTRTGYFYSYVFNFESMTWHKVSRVYDLLINDYPDLLGVNTAGLFNLSLHSSATHQSMLIVTQAQSLTMNEVFKKIERLALRCTINTDIAKYFTLVVFASNDLKTWQIITGGQRTGYIKNILLTRSHCSAQYYIIMLSGKIRNDSNFTSVDVSFSPRLNNKLRR